jgi:hypothetical protein
VALTYYDGARALIEQSAFIFRSARPKDNLGQWVGVFGDKQIALRHLKSVPPMLAIAQPEQKYNDIVRLLGGSEAASAQAIWYKKMFLRPGAARR